MASRAGNSIEFSTKPSDLFKLSDVDAEDFENSRRDCDRDLCRHVLNDVLENVSVFLRDKGGVDCDVIEKLRSSWLSKLAISDADDFLEKDDEGEGPTSVPHLPAAAADPKRKPAFIIPLTKPHRFPQLDGHNDSSEDEDDVDVDDDDDDDNDDDDDDDSIIDDEDDVEDGADEEPALGSGDDISDEDPSDLFNTSNVVVCQFDKITRARNKWKFHLKDGIMNLNGRDYVFQRASGDAEW